MSGLVISEQVENIRFNWLLLTNESGKKGSERRELRPECERREGRAIGNHRNHRSRDVGTNRSAFQNSRSPGLRSGRHRPEQLYSN
jgi:hypothetical protein